MQALILPTSGQLGPLSSDTPVSLLPLLGRPLLEHLRSQMPKGKITLASYEHPEALESAYPDLTLILAHPDQSPQEIWQKARIRESCLILREGILLHESLDRLFKAHYGNPYPLSVLLGPGKEEIGVIVKPGVKDPWNRSQPHQVINIKGYSDARTPAGYLAMHRDALLGNIPIEIPGTEQSPGVWIEKGASVHPSAKLEAPCWISHRASVGRECQLFDSYLEAQVLLERGAKLNGVVALDGTRLGKATQWNRQILAGCYSIGEEVYAHEQTILASIGNPGFEWSLDRILAGLLLVALSPLLVLIAILIALDSPGPVFYSQLRVGQGSKSRWGAPRPYRGRVFDLYKFRTMRLDADQRQTELAQGELFYKPKTDPRVTRLGHLLRKTSLDELPQLVNVLKGDIRLVGNRPLPLYEAERLDQAWQWRRFEAPAGITGLWQISGRSDLEDIERLVLDSYYATHRTRRGDLGILLKTLPVLLSRRGAR